VKEPTVYLEDLYSVLGVAPNSTVATIKEAYKGLVFQNHPDRNDSVEALYIFRNASHAYQTLGRDPKLRSEYDSKYMSRMYLSVLEGVGTEVLRPLAMDVAVPLINFTARALSSFLRPVIASSISTTSAMLEVWGSNATTSGEGHGGEGELAAAGGGSKNNAEGGVMSDLTDAFSRFQRVGDLLSSRSFEAQREKTIDQTAATSEKLQASVIELSKTKEVEAVLTKAVDELMVLQAVVEKRSAAAQASEVTCALEFEAMSAEDARLRSQCELGAQYLSNASTDKANVSASIFEATADVAKLEQQLAEARRRVQELTQQEVSIQESVRQMEVTTVQLNSQREQVDAMLQRSKEQLEAAQRDRAVSEKEVGAVVADLKQATDNLAQKSQARSVMERRIEQLKKKESALSEVLLRMERERAAVIEQKRKRELTSAQASRQERVKELERLKAAQASLENEVMEDEKRIKSLLDVEEASQ